LQGSDPLGLLGPRSDCTTACHHQGSYASAYDIFAFFPGALSTASIWIPAGAVTVINQTLAGEDIEAFYFVDSGYYTAGPGTFLDGGSFSGTVYRDLGGDVYYPPGPPPPKPYDFAKAYRETVGSVNPDMKAANCLYGSIAAGFLPSPDELKDLTDWGLDAAKSLGEFLKNPAAIATVASTAHLTPAATAALVNGSAKVAPVVGKAAGTAAALVGTYRAAQAYDEKFSAGECK
jgi:hypothetical protein